jgi:hypothetical protein
MEVLVCRSYILFLGQQTILMLLQAQQKERKMETRKVWWRSRTVWINVLMLLISILTVFQESPMISPESLIIANSIVNVILRFITVDAIGMFDVK